MLQQPRAAVSTVVCVCCRWSNLEWELLSAD